MRWKTQKIAFKELDHYWWFNWDVDLYLSNPFSCTTAHLFIFLSKTESEFYSLTLTFSPRYGKNLGLISTGSNPDSFWLRRCFPNKEKESPRFMENWASSKFFSHWIDAYWCAMGTNLYNLFFDFFSGFFKFLSWMSFFEFFVFAFWTFTLFPVIFCFCWNHKTQLHLYQIFRYQNYSC